MHSLKSKTKGKSKALLKRKQINLSKKIKSKQRKSDKCNYNKRMSQFFTLQSCQNQKLYLQQIQRPNTI